MGQMHLIGHYNLKETIVETEHYECAAWYRKVEVQPGRYEVVTDDYWAIIRFHGIIVASNMSSHFGRVRYGSKIDEDVGQEMRASRQINLNTIFDDPNFEILPEYFHGKDLKVGDTRRSQGIVRASPRASRIFNPALSLCLYFSFGRLNDFSRYQSGIIFGLHF